MGFLIVLEGLSILALVLVVVTQLIIPVILGRKIFPMFRRQHKLEVQLNEVEEQKAELDLEKKLVKERAALEQEYEKLAAEREAFEKSKSQH
jgi:hypothetical protein